MRIFGVNSNRTKPGPRGTDVKSLLFWEGEWYWIFHGLAFGLPARDEPHTSWILQPGPRLLAWKPKNQRPIRYEEFDRKLVREWEAKPLNQRFKQVTERKRVLAIPAEPKSWERLKNAQSAHEICAACDESIFWLNAQENRRPYTTKLKENAEAFMAAKEYRYPQSNRPSSEIKRVIHFARAMAGITEGISGVTAIDRIRLLRHRKRCPCISCAIERNKKLQKDLYALLHSKPNA